MREEWKQTILERYTTRYHEIWADVKKSLSQPGDAFTMMGSTNYIFSTRGVQWAIDPRFNWPFVGNPDDTVDLGAVFNRLSFVLVTHKHGDHFDPGLMTRFPELNWIVPDHLAELLPDVRMPNLTVVRAGDELLRDGIRIRAFASSHYDEGTTVGVKETGYFIDTGMQRILYPGDIRDYNNNPLPRFECVTHLFSHIWLGRRKALDLPCEPYVTDFARFMLSFGAGKIFLTHTMDPLRKTDDMCTYLHAGLIMDAMIGMDPAADVSIPLPGKRIAL